MDFKKRPISGHDLPKRIASLLLTLFTVVTVLNCKEKESVITIVDIADLDRIGLAKELSIIKKCSPKVIGMDFLLTTDSIEKDTQLSAEIAGADNLVQVSELHRYHDLLRNWMVHEKNRPQFLNNNHGYANVVTDDDKVLIYELPMKQNHLNEEVFAFSYLVSNKFKTTLDSKYTESGIEDVEFTGRKFSKHFKVISPQDLFNGNYNKEDLKDKIVLMGIVSDDEDYFYLDVLKTSKISGVEVHANFIEQILK